MTDVETLRVWLATLPSDSAVAIGDDGLTLVEIRSPWIAKELGAYLEIGGIPKD